MRKKTGMKRIHFSKEELEDLRKKPIEEIKPIIKELDDWRRRSLFSDLFFIDKNFLKKKWLINICHNVNSI